MWFNNITNNNNSTSSGSSSSCNTTCHSQQSPGVVISANNNGRNQRPNINGVRHHHQTGVTPALNFESKFTPVNTAAIKSPASCYELPATIDSNDPMDSAGQTSTSNNNNQQQTTSDNNSYRAQHLSSNNNSYAAAGSSQQTQVAPPSNKGGGGGGSNSGANDNKITFYLKTSIFTKRVTLERNKLALGTIKQFAIAFLNELFFQDQYQTNTIIGEYVRRHFSNNDNLNSLYDRLVLKIHRPSDGTFSPFNSVSDIEPESYLCIEVSERGNHPHHLLSTSEQQHLSKTLPHPSTSTMVPSVSSSSSMSSAANTTSSNIRTAHDFHSETFLLPTFCSNCSKLIKGVYKQGHQCYHCKKNFCNDCKTKAQSTADGCLARMSSVLPNVSGQLSAIAVTSDIAAGTSMSGANSSMGFSGSSNDPSSSSASLSSQPTTTHQLEANSNTAGHNSHPSQPPMSKRKSASNLLPFNLPNLFKSHHSSHQQPTVDACGRQPNEVDNKSPKVQSSTGMLEPVLQQLSKLTTPNESAKQANLHATTTVTTKDKSNTGSNGSSSTNNNNNFTTTLDTEGSNNLLIVQSAHLSSSHHNLFASKKITGSDDKPVSQEAQLSCSGDGSGHGGSASVHHSPISGSTSNHRAHVSQMSNSARTSYQDIHTVSPVRREQPTHHAFVSLTCSNASDSMAVNNQLTGLAADICGVCKKSFKFSASTSNEAKDSKSTSIATNQRAQPSPQLMPSACKVCKLQVHVQCQKLALDDCMSRVAEASRAAALERQGSSAKGSLVAKNSSTSQDGDGSNGRRIKSTNSNVSRDNIRLHRLAPSFKHVRRPDATKPIIEGWLKHTTLSDEQARQHYWRLDDTDITLYENDTSTRYFKAIALTKITRVMSANSLPKCIREDVLTTTTTGTSNNASATSPTLKPKSADTSPTKTSDFQAQMKAMFAFELNTGSVYLVQANSEQEASKWHGSLADITAKLNNSQPSSPSSRAKLDAHEGKERSPTSAIIADETKQKSTNVSSSTDTKPASSSSQAAEAVTVGPAKEFAGQANEAANDGSLINTSRQTHVSKQQQTTSTTASTTTTSTTALAATTHFAPETTQGKSSTIVTPAQRHYHHHHQQPREANYRGQSAKTYADPSRSRLYNRPRKTIKLNPMNTPDHFIVHNDETTKTCHKYLIERNKEKGYGFEELGSGQFGKVFAAISEIKAEDPSRGLWTGIPVAIKEISKARFDLRQQAKLKNEANILSRLDHPGVIVLERVHDLPDKIYIIMEQLEDDMLEMIVNTPEKRLSERVTKFLTFQILEALRHLHSKNIVHCDLKPENVLLVERNAQFPQIKLCDFGFAKIIEENSFRCSLVGTPAYLAPEVVKGEKYNRSVDLWSVGVIVYVSLSGEFPFNEGENIHDQISRANFMYPDQPWAKISLEAKDFINSLLRVNRDARLSASRAQMDKWIVDYQLWCDLIELEVRVGKRWVTDDADYKRWSNYARERNLPIPRSAVQLHEELMAD